jgi:hypothetical protein
MSLFLASYSIAYANMISPHADQFLILASVWWLKLGRLAKAQRHNLLTDKSGYCGKLP